MELTVDNKGFAFLIADRYRVLRNISLQVIILLITIGIFFDAPDTLNLSFNRFCGWLAYYLFMNMLVYVNVYLLFPHFLAKDKIIQYVIVVVLFAVVALFILMILQDLFYDIAVSRNEPSPIAIFLSLASSLLAIILFITGTSALLLFRPLIQSNIKERELQKATTESELKFLKSQINPHFLFNTINNANILIDEDPEMSAHILTKLNDLLHYQFTDSVRDKVCLADDISLLTDYLELEKVRRDRFEFNIETWGDTKNVFIAPLLFIPFVENAVKHNLNSNGISYVNISLGIGEQSLVFICENSKSMRVNPTQMGGIGLSNIVRRLQLLYEDRYSLEKEETEENYKVKLTVML
ncbi:histidine kinase [Sphingobacterium thalpophilum]|uniref:sensor histidine kinase n=1 Tax=Sphingobacterium TaxID=28453 RepID=UPI002244EA64|nr:histidine kinase [Sphingobacterium sp. InxBP1]MCW8313801.1 histidine kinase [Sphingobacterium sp. InxBP1]